MSIAKITRIHEQAMDAAEKAFLIKDVNSAQRKRLLRTAFEGEHAAAELAQKTEVGEPTRSVLLRSAASLALNCGKVREAERLAALGLAGEPPAEIAEELREVLERVQNVRQLEARGVTADGGEPWGELAAMKRMMGDLTKRLSAVEKRTHAAV